MIKYAILAICFFSLSACSITGGKGLAKVSPINLLVEGQSSPLNVHSQKPRLSWHANVRSQAYYQIQVASEKSKLLSNKANLWDSGKVLSRRSLNIDYQGMALKTNETIHWRVRVWEESDPQPGKWSDISSWEMGLLHKEDWQATWIQVEQPLAVDAGRHVSNWIAMAGTVQSPSGSYTKRAIDRLTKKPTASYFKKEFFTSKKLLSAKLHSTAAGYYEVFINGKQVDNRVMDPGQTDFDKRILYNTDNVKSLVREGENTILVHLGSGWYDENIAFFKPSKDLSYGQPKFIAQLELYYTDGSHETIVTDENWLSHASPVIKEGIFSGEVYDARRSQNLSNWKPVKALRQWPTKELESQLLPPIRAVKTIHPKKIYNPKPDVWVFDFGQNFTGVPTLNLDELNLSTDQAVFLRYAEWANAEGNISQLSGGGWATHLNQVDAYISSGNDKSSWTPTFTWHGFRYIEITGLKRRPVLKAIHASLLRSDVTRTGTFISSNAHLNKIHDTALWTYESNLMSVPMDCPIREKAGWTGDAHAGLITGNYNFNLQNFWRKYLADFKTAANIAPSVVPGKRTSGKKIDWAVAEVFIAWEHYRHHGDAQTLEAQYSSLLELMEFGQGELSHFLLQSGYGDWCDPVRKPGTPRVGGRGTPQHTSPAITSTALFAHAAKSMAKIAGVLSKPSDHKRFDTLFKNISRGFHEAFYDIQTGHYGSQTADAMALRFGITPPELRQGVADALNKDVVDNWKGHSSVGALGQTWLYLALSDYGYADTAFNIFMAKGYPGFSYLFDTLNGTTLWERKGAYNPSGERPPIRSLNHPFHSGYDGWFYQGLGGIRPLEGSVGFQDFELNPVFPQGLDSVDVSYTTGYGEIKSKLSRRGNTIRWSVVVPQNSKAYIPSVGNKKMWYAAGSYEFDYEESTEKWRVDRH